MHGRRIYHARGKVLGGSSSINGMIFQRGNPLDYERWSSDPGMRTWDYAHCLPYFRRMEHSLAAEPGDEFRGAAGPLVLERGPATNPLFGAFFEAARQAGFELTDDVNGYRQEGFAAFDRNIHRGRRLSAAGAYLHPVMSRPNLEVRTRAFVHRIVFEGSRAVGVEVSRGRRAPTRISAGEIDRLRRRDQLAADAAALGRRPGERAPGARDRRRSRPTRGRREPPGPPRGLRAARVHAAGLDGALPQVAIPAVDRVPVAVPPFGPRRDEPLRGRRVRPEQRRRPVPEPDVPLPADRRSLRRFGAGERPRLSGAHRADVLGREGFGEDHEPRSARPSRAAIQLPVDRPGSAGMGRGDPHGAADPRSARDGAVRRGRALAGPERPDRRGDPRVGRPRCRDRPAPLVHVQDGDGRDVGRGSRPRCASTASRVSGWSTPRSSRTSRTATSTLP